MEKLQWTFWPAQYMPPPGTFSVMHVFFSSFHLPSPLALWVLGLSFWTELVLSRTLPLWACPSTTAETPMRTGLHLGPAHGLYPLIASHLPFQAWPQNWIYCPFADRFAFRSDMWPCLTGTQVDGSYELRFALTPFILLFLAWINTTPRKFHSLKHAPCYKLPWGVHTSLWPGCQASDSG